MSIKKRGLGRNLEALLGDFNKTKNADPSDVTHIEGELRHLSLTSIQVGKYQPRIDFSEEALEELANSIRAQGIIQPIVVRSKANNNFEIIAGERRFRAAKIAGLTTIPALVRELPDEAAIAIALIENIQREDLNPIEEALALQRLISEFALTHEQIANAVGKSRVTVTNLLRLLTLPEAIKECLAEGKLEMGHARALLAVEPHLQLEAVAMIIGQRLSVRQTEALVRKLQESDMQTKPLPKQDLYLHDKQNSLIEYLNTPVFIQQNAKGRGKVVIKYKNVKELEKIIAQIIQ